MGVAMLIVLSLEGVVADEDPYKSQKMTQFVDSVSVRLEGMLDPIRLSRCDHAGSGPDSHQGEMRMRIQNLRGLLGLYKNMCETLHLCDRNGNVLVEEEIKGIKDSVLTGFISDYVQTGQYSGTDSSVYLRLVESVIMPAYLEASAKVLMTTRVTSKRISGVIANTILLIGCDLNLISTLEGKCEGNRDHAPVVLDKRQVEAILQRLHQYAALSDTALGQ